MSNREFVLLVILFLLIEIGYFFGWYSESFSRNVLSPISLFLAGVIVGYDARSRRENTKKPKVCRHCGAQIFGKSVQSEFGIDYHPNCYFKRIERNMEATREDERNALD